MVPQNISPEIKFESNFSSMYYVDCSIRVTALLGYLNLEFYDFHPTTYHLGIVKFKLSEIEYEATFNS